MNVCRLWNKFSICIAAFGFIAVFEVGASQPADLPPASAAQLPQWRGFKVPIGNPPALPERLSKFDF
jgi:hypothetical protein